jgi:hypothetical protein
MHYKFISRLLMAILLLVPQFIYLPSSSVHKVNAQATTLSFITPYYGTKDINSYFDHSFPTYATNNVFVRYNGQLMWVEVERM